MQDYDFYYSTSTSSETAGTTLQPSPKVVRNILGMRDVFKISAWGM